MSLIHPTLHVVNRAKRFMLYKQKVKDKDVKDILFDFESKIDKKGAHGRPQKQQKIHSLPRNHDLQGEMTNQISLVMQHLRQHCSTSRDEQLFCRIEKLLYLCFLLLSAKDNTERMKHIGSYLIFTSDKSLLGKAQNFLDKQLRELFPTQHLLQGDLREILDNWDRANESPLATKLRAVASYCMAFSLLENWGLHTEFAEVIYAEFRVQKETKKVTSFIYSILDVIEFVLSRARICYDTGTLAPLFHNSSTYLDWYAQVDEVKLMSRMRVGMEVSGFKQADYFKLLESVINKGETLVKFGKTIQDRKVMQSILSELKILRHESMIEGVVSKTREMPFAALVFGDSSIGKSTITEILGKQYARVTGLDYDPSIVYYRSSFDQYMSGYNSSKWMIVLDDIACLEPSKCTNGDLSIIDAIQLINCAPYLSNQAELEKKGKVPVLAKLVIANSNVKNLNVFHYFSHPSAVQRRFQCVITPYVKKEFRKIGENGPINALDGVLAAKWQEKHPPIEGSEQTPDFWEFDITEWLPAPVGKEKSLAIEHKPFDYKLNMQQMLCYFEMKILNHLSAQSTMVKNVDGLRSAKVCGLCHTDRQFCLNRNDHRQFDDMKCDDCNKYDCMYLNDCRPCNKCAMPNSRCRCHGDNITIDDINSMQVLLPRWMLDARPHSIDDECVKWLCEENHEISVLKNGTIISCDCHPNLAYGGMGAYERGSNLFNLQGDVYCAKCGFSDCLWMGDEDSDVNTTCPDCKHCISDEDLATGECVWCMVKKHNLKYKLQGKELLLLPCAAITLLFAFSKRKSIPAPIRERSPRFLGSVGDYVDNKIDDVKRNIGFAQTARSVYNQWWKTRDVIVRAGAHAHDYLQKRPAFAIFGLVLTAIASIKSLFTLSQSFFLQGEMKSAPETVDPWKREKYRLSKVDLGVSVHNMRQYSKEKFFELVTNNMLHLDIRTSYQSTKCEAICIADRYYLMNAHNLPKEGEFTADIYRSEDLDGVNENLSGVKMHTSMITHLGGDKAILFIPHIPPRKNIIELFTSKNYKANTHGFYAYKNRDGTAMVLTKNINNHLAHHNQIDDDKKFSAFESTTDENTFVGLCGCPLIAETKLGYAILGFHVMGYERSAVATHVTVESLREFMKDKNPIDMGIPNLNCSQRDYSLQGLDRRSIFNFIEKGCVTEFGSLKGHHSNPKSKVSKTLIADYLIKHEGFAETHTAPVLKGWGPWRLAALPMVKKDFSLPYHVIKNCVEDYFDCVTERCKELHLLEIVSEEVAINGQEGVRGVDRIDMSTSAGFPFNTMKQHFFESNDNGFKTWVPKPEIRNMLDNCLETYRQGRRNCFVFMGALKDEPREFKKVSEQNTRVFMGQNVVHLILGRQYFLSFIRVMQRNRLDFECAVGTNAHSYDWDSIAHYLFDFSDYLFDGDYSKYDKEMMAFVIMEIFDGIINFMGKHMVLTDDDRTIMRGIAYDISYAYVNFNGDLVTFLRNNPSGHLLTVIVNSICGSVYLRFGFIIATGKPVDQFREFVRPVTYGDDVVVSVHPTIKDKFNFTTYQAALKKYDMKFTPASKDGEAYLFQTKKDLDFLKRSFVIHDNLGRFVAPLSIKSIYKSLVTGIMSESITPEKQIVQVMSSAWREAYMHGKKFFNEFESLVERIIKYHKLQGYVGKNDFPSYELLTRYYLGDGSTAWAMEDPIDFDQYVLQGEGDRFLIKTTGTLTYSYCLQGKIDNLEENGYVCDTRMGAPRSLYLEKIPQVIKIETSDAAMVNKASDNNRTADHYKTEEEHTSQSTQTQISTQMMTSDVVSGEISKRGSNVARQSEFNTDISEFLKRPVEIQSVNLSTATSNVITGNAFQEWLNMSEVKNKLQNYALMRGTLCLKVQVDGSSFAYGGVLVNVAPGEDADSNADLTKITYHSQKQMAIIDFARNVDAELKAQILMPTEWVRLNIGNGSIGVRHAYHIIPILNPQLATGGSVTIGMRVYVWMEDIELHGATAYTLQGDVTVHAKQNLAHAERSVQDASLVNATLRPSDYLPVTETLKELLTVNPIVHYFDWDQTLSGGDRLVSYGVNPEIRNTDTTNSIIFGHPLEMFSRYFQYWRGSLKFTFKVFSSPHHAGTIRLFWDPTGAYTSGSIVTGTDGNLTTVLTKLWNIRESDTCEFIVPHDNYKAWFATRVGYIWSDKGFNVIDSTTLPDRYPTSLGVHNGNLGLKVFTRLNSPTTTSSVRIMMSLSAGDDFEFAQMLGGPTYSSYKLQGDTELYMGEKFNNLQHILSRPSVVYIFTPPTAPGPAAAYFPIYPPLAGFVSNGPWVIPGTITPGTSYNANACRQTLMARLIDCHVGVTGSTNWMISVTGGGQSTSSIGYGPAAELQAPSGGLLAKITTSTIKYGQLIAKETAYESGREIFNPIVNPIHEVHIPCYMSYRYISYNNINTVAPVMSYETDFTSDNSYHRLAVSAGPDFALVRFRGIQPQYVYPTPWINV